MATAGADPVVGVDVGRVGNRLGLRTEIVPDEFPGVARLGVDAERRRRLIPAMRHAILAARIADLAADHPVLVPVHLVEHLLVSLIMTVGHQITGSLPSFDVAGRDGPGRAMQVAFAGKEFQVNGRTQQRVFLSPLDDFGKFLLRQFPGQEEVFRAFVEPLEHVFLGGVVLVPGADRVAVHAEMGEEIEHLLDLIHVGFLVDGRIRGDLISQDLGHLDRFDAFFEDAFAFDNQVVDPFQGVHVDIPVHPLGRRDAGAAVVLAFADFGGFLFGDQLPGDQLRQLRLGVFRGVGAGEVFTHFLAHEHGVGADVNDATLVQQTLDKFLDLRINGRFTAADGNHGGAAFLRRLQTIFQAHHVLQRGRVLADAATARARQVTGVQRLQLEHECKLLGLLDFVGDDVPGNFCGKRQWESHAKRLLVLFFRPRPIAPAPAGGPLFAGGEVDEKTF